MADFASLLGQFQQNTQTLASRPREEVEEPQLARKRARPLLVDANDLPPVKSILLLCPAGAQTGGPEALHQLCHVLNTSTDVDAYMVYAVSSGGENHVEFASRSRTPVIYQHYSAPAVSYDPLVEGNETHLLIWPEVWTDFMMNYQSSLTKSSPCAIWWLSVDNNTSRFKAWDRNDILHLHQSEYAKQHLLKNGAKHVHALTEYISDPPTPDSRERTIDVLYNPYKGIHYTDEIRKRSASSIELKPIGGGPDGRVRISPQQVRSLLQNAKIYMDFGPHPGMDRLPREAALAGCLVVTNMEGAALYDADVPLPEKYKVKTFNAHEVHKLFKDLLANYKDRTEDLQDYRTWIGGQQEKMKECVKKLVEELTTKRAVATSDS